MTIKAQILKKANAELEMIFRRINKLKSAKTTNGNR